jgi:hypothetical protein
MLGLVSSFDLIELTGATGAVTRSISASWISARLATAVAQGRLGMVFRLSQS